MSLAIAIFYLLEPSHFVERSDDIVLCDDGSPLWTRDRRPNWDCWLDGCTPHDDICWADRLDHCSGRDGDDLGVCDYNRKGCQGLYECFKMWYTCTGEYGCQEPGTLVGCNKGTCTIASAPAENAAEDAAEYSADTCEPDILWTSAESPGDAR